MATVDIQNRRATPMTADGTTLTNTTTETILADSAGVAQVLRINSPQYGKPTLKVGDAFKISGSVQVPGTNSTDTLVLTLKNVDGGGSGDIWEFLAATDVADDDFVTFEGTLVVRELSTAAGDDGVLEFNGTSSGVVAGAAAQGADSSAVTTNCDTTTEISVYVTAEWSVANAGNQCHLAALHGHKINA